jgi:hypothetical protein
MQQVHRIDDQRDVGCVLAGGISELLLGNDRMPGKRLGPPFGTGAGKVAVNPPDAGFPEFRDFLNQPVHNLGRRVDRVDVNG